MNPYESSTFGNSLSLRVDGAIGAMSLSPNGRDAVLAGRKGLFIIDLDDPFLAPRWLHHITSWEVADVQWSPHHSLKPSWCVSTSNQKALLWDLARPSNNAIQNVLHRHVRAITDINFHPQDPELLATCSIDTFVYCWDMRTPRRPVKKWAEWRAGATQVKWNRNNPFQIASSHHHSFYIWDSRMGTLPLLEIENAHEGKINGLDFNSNEDRIISCSNDKTIKVWNLGSARESTLEPSVVINCEFPVARARSLPFGEDNCCGIMPVMGGSNAIHFVNFERAYQESKVHNDEHNIKLNSEVSFRGHQGPVKDFLWRVQYESYKAFHRERNGNEFQLVTWSPTDYDLKLWPLEKLLYQMVNYIPDFIITNRDRKPESTMEYNSYITEPKTSLRDLLKSASDDLLSRLAVYEIKKLQKQENSWGQLNHLNWISGVRMGTRLPVDGNINSASSDSRHDSPANLGEEISIVGHKFPKIRFEKISVSTGHIILSLRGPVPLHAAVTQDSAKALEQSLNIDVSILKKNISQLASDKSTRIHQDSVNITQVSSAGEMANSAHKSNDSGFLKGNVNSNDECEVSYAQTDQAITKAPDNNNESKLIFIRLEIRFPNQYPNLKHSELNSKLKRTIKHKRASSVKFEVEETHELNEEIKNAMIHNLEKISQFYTMKYNKYCLEPCLRYLLGDRIDLDDSLMVSNDLRPDKNLTTTSQNAYSLVFEPDISPFTVDGALRTSSAPGLVSQDLTYTLKYLTLNHNDRDFEEEDNYHDIDLIPTAEDDLEMGIEMYDTLGSAVDTSQGFGFKTIQHNITPLPKACSAIWTRSGQLVCFFAPKPISDDSRKEKDYSQFVSKKTQNSTSVRYGSRTPVSSALLLSDEELIAEEHGIKANINRVKNSSDFDPPELLNSSTSESSEDFSDDWDGVLNDDLKPYLNVPTAFREGVKIGRLRATPASKNSVYQVSGKGTASNPSYVEDAILRSTKKYKRSNSAKHYIRIHDLNHLIPDRADLAKSYVLTGKSMRELARHNREVALRLQVQEVSEAWGLVELILMAPDRGSLNLIELGESLPQDQISLRQDPYWGFHPFGPSWLVKVLFDYFERRNNLQMLAMISCMFYERVNDCTSFERNDKLGCHVANTMKTNTTNMLFKPGDYLHPESLNTSGAGVITDAEYLRKFEPLSIGQMHLSKPIALPHERGFSPNFPFSLKKTRESMTILKQPLANGPKRSADRRSVDLARRATPQNPLSTSRGLGRLQKSTHAPSPNRDKSKFAVTVSINMVNAEEFDLKATSHNSKLLACIDPATIEIYRNKYAELLYSWDLPYERIQMLKYNHSSRSSYASIPASTDYQCHFTIRSRKFYDKKQDLINPISPTKESSLNAWNTTKRNQLQYCSFCCMIASRRVLFCLDCEHILHFNCAENWWSSSESSSAGESCPAGCGCVCASSRWSLRESRVF